MTTAAARTTTSDALDYQPSYLAAALVTAAVLVLYIVTLSPSTAMWDTSEYMAAAYTLGVPHPPGNPLFVLLGRAFAVLPIAPTVAMRINLLAAVTSALSAGLWFLVTERVLASWLRDRWLRIAGAAAAAIVGATAFTVWNQSVVNEKVYTVSLLGMAAISWLAVRWLDDPDSPRADRYLVLIAFLLGLGYSNHMAGFLAAPAVGLAVLIRRPRTFLRWRLVLAAVGALVLGLSPFVTQPIRSAHYPALNMGEPTACRYGLEAGCTFSAETLERWQYHMERGQYGKPELGMRQAPFSSQLGMLWLYFKWQWLRDVWQQHQGLQLALATVFLALGLVGGWTHFERDRRTFWYVGPLMATLSVLLVYYLNFKLGFSQAFESGLGFDSRTTEVRDRDYFYLWFFSAWSVWVGVGLVFVWETLARLVSGRGDEREPVPPRRAWLVASPVLLLALVPLVGNWRWASRAGETFTRDWAVDLLNSVEPYGILITQGDNDTYPLWYAQEVEGVRKDVTVAVTSLLNTDWYIRQLLRRPIYEYDAERGPAVYRGREWKKPTGPIVDLTFEQADSIPPYIQLTQPQRFQAGQIQSVVAPGILTRDQILTLRMLMDNVGERSVHLSSGDYYAPLGLEPYVIRQGLAQKISQVPIVPSRDTLRMPGDGWLDVQRSLALWRNDFVGPSSLFSERGWRDRASAGIPYQYAVTGAMLAAGLAQTGREQEAARVYDVARRVTDAARLDLMLGLRLPPTMPRAVGPAQEGGD